MARSPGNPLIPSHHGVAASCVALPPLKQPPWPTLLDFLDHRMPTVGRATWQLRLQSGLVVDERGAALPPTTPYQGGARVYYYRSVSDETPIPFEETVLFQDAHLVVADKPHFLPVTPGGRYVQETLLVRLQQRLGLPALAPLHRIDRETAGLVLFAVNPTERGAYHALFSGRTMRKHYEAIAAFSESLRSPQVHRSQLRDHATDFFRMCEVPAAEHPQPNSETRIELLERHGEWARYGLEPLTGKRHQLRVHMNALGLPIVGDQLYPHTLHGPNEAEDFSTPLRLLAKSLAFTDPVTGEARRFESARGLDWPAARSAPC
ncbi:pseudouridine synthase [Hydrogenophaga sp.]|uniref:pseudouridine synthase n=1 Tax=Hydrogenophaga sp. TaxID=1904254 RepID=UPI00356581A7